LLLFGDAGAQVALALVVLGSRPRQRGFTLIEMMITVAIVGILATLAIFGVSKYVRLSKSAEATQMIGAFKASQETYKSDMFSYLDVSGSNAISDASYYPTQALEQKAHSWVQVEGSETPLGLRIKQLGVVADGPVQFIYACAAGNGTQIPAGHQLLTTPVDNWPAAATGQPWYVVSAKADLNGNGVESRFASASFTTQIFVENEGE
jgi:prepilin-type N-terminal cleavage/methylation domain-containing protein